MAQEWCGAFGADQLSWLTLEATELSQAGEYSVLVSNIETNIVSDIAHVVVEPANVPLNYWHHRHAAAELKPLSKLAYGAGLFAAVDDEGGLRLSEDGLHWRDLILNTADRLTNVRWVNNAFTAVGENGTIAFSSTGMDWVTASVGKSVTLSGVTWGNNTYVAVGDGGSIFTSEDLAHWREESTFVSDRLNSVAFDSELFVAVGDNGTILTSSDGSAWDCEFADTFENLVAVAGGKVFTTVGENDVWFVRNRNGWQSARIGQFLKPGLPKSLTYVVSFQSGYYVGGPGYSMKAELSGSGGNSYVGTPAPFQLRDATVAGESVVGIGSGGALLLLRGAQPMDIAGAFHMRGVAANEQTCVAIGRNGSILTSTNLVTWISAKSDVTNHLNGIIYRAGYFITVGAAGAILVSTDGTTWQQLESGTTNDLLAMAASKDRIVAVGNKGTVLTSTDGLHWNVAQSVSTNSSLQWITYGNDKFVATDRLSIWVSQDGEDWRRLDRSQSPSDSGPVAFGAGKFVMVWWTGNTSLPVYTSSDGETWTRVAAALPHAVFQVKFEAGNFVAFGRDGRFFSSADGLQWLERNTVTAWELRDVTVFQNSLVAVGDYGLVLESDPFADSPPTIIQHPISQTAAPGIGLLLKVIARGTSPLHYQWRLNNVPIAGGTNAVLVLNNARSQHSGAYDVVVSNEHGKDFSQAAEVIIQRGDAAERPTLGARLTENGIVLTIVGGTAGTYRIEYTDELSAAAAWRLATTVNTAASPVVFSDGNSSNVNTRFYRAVRIQ